MSWMNKREHVRVITAEYWVDLTSDQWYTVETDLGGRITSMRDAGGFVWLNKTLADELKQNSAFQTYLVARLTHGTNVPEWYWDKIWLLEERGWSYACEAKYHFEQLASTTKFQTNGGDSYNYHCGFRFGEDYRMAIGFNTIAEAMLFKLTFG